MQTRTLYRIAWAAVFGLVGVAAAWSAPPAPGKQGRTTSPQSVSRTNLARALARRAPVATPTTHRGTPAATTNVQPQFLNLVALRVEFPNLAFGDSPPADELHDRFFYEVWFEHVREYFSVASKGRAEVSVFVADGVALAANDQEYYGDFADYDSLMVELTGEAVEFFDSVVDFSAYDGVILLHAGPGQESDLNGDSPLQIWSGFLDQMVFEEQLSTPDTTITGIPTDDGAEIQDVVVLPEWEVQDLPPGGGTRLGHMGVYVHEIGQKFGMIPMFDADPSPFPDSQGIGNFGVMGYGLWVANGFIPALPGAFNRSLMGWVDPIVLDGTGTVELRDYEQGAANAVVAKVPISEREYFLVSYIVEDPDGPLDSPCDVMPRRFFNFNDANGDCRFNYEDLNNDGVMSAGDLIDTYAGAEWDFFMTDLGNPPTFGEGWGLLVMHVDELVLEEVLERGTNVQGDPVRKAVDIEEADGIEDLDRVADNVRAFGSADDYFGLGRTFGTSTTPDSRSTNGAPTGIEIELVDLPDRAPSPVLPSVTVPGGRARVQIRRAPAGASAPERTARRVIDGHVGADLVTMPLPRSAFEALVVPADSGVVFLLDAALDEAPNSDGDPATLQPWVTLPPELAGAWVGGGAVGDVSGDGVMDVVFVANVDSMGSPRTRLFGWSNTGAGLGATGTPLLASLPGSGLRPFLFDVDGENGDEVVFASTSDAGVSLHVFPRVVVACPDQAKAFVPVASRAGARLLGGPIGTQFELQSCTRGVSWVEMDTTNSIVELCYRGLACCDAVVERVELVGASPHPVRLVAGDLNGDGDDVVIVADGAGTVFEVRVAAGSLKSQRLATLGSGAQSPLALADLDANGTLEILAATSDAMHALTFSGASVAGWPYRFALDPRLAIEDAPANGAGSPVAADLDADGSMNVLVHLQAGAALVWDAEGQRRRDLEAAFGATDVVSPRLADFDDDGALEAASLAQFERLVRFDPVTGERITAPRTEIMLWRYPASGDVAWSGLGGDAGVSFRSEDPMDVPPTPNATDLPSFIVVPNPVSDALKARVELTAPARVRCALYNLEGEIVAQASRDGQAGEVVEFTFDVRDVASGIYLARMQLSTGGTRLRTVAVRH